MPSPSQRDVMPVIEPTNPIDRGVWALRHRIPELEAEVERLREVLEIAYDGLLRTTRDESFDYESKKAVEDHVRRVLKESGVDV